MPANSTFYSLQQDLLNNLMRRQTAEYKNYLPTLINDVQDQICSRKKYWFLEVRQQFNININNPNWWQVILPAGASYATITEDIEGVWEITSSGRNNPLEYLPYDEAISLYYLPSANQAIAPRGQIETYSETTDYTGILLFPVPIQNTTILVEWRAKSLPDWDGVSQVSTNILLQQYYNVFAKLCVAISFRDFFGMKSRGEIEVLEWKELVKETLDREHTQKRWQRIKTLPLRKGMEIPRQKQISPFRTPPWTL